MRSTTSIGILSIAAFGAIGAASAAAAPLLWVDDVYGQIGTVDIADTAVNVIGNTENVLSDIGFDSSGNLYGVDLSSNLYSVSQTTGLASVIGDSGDGVGFNSLVGGPGGLLYAAAYNSTDLYTINSATGKDTVVGNVGFEAAGDLAFVNGVLYESAVDPKSSGTDDLIKITLAPTFSATEIGSFSAANVFGLASDDNGVLYALAGTQIYTANLNTAALTPVLNFSGNSAGLGVAYGEAFLNESAGAITSPVGSGPSSLVPLPSAVSAGIIVLASLAGFALLRRRTTAAPPAPCRPLR